MAQYNNLAGEILGRIRASNPVVHSITNYVVMNSTANVLLAMGASPIMAHATEELSEIVSIASSIVINIGTLSPQWIESMNYACRLAKVASKPLILDPVGSGATKLRTDTACKIVKTTVPTVVRGNASEILSLSPHGGVTRGVDSMHSMNEAFDAAKALAANLGTCIAVTGKEDLVTDGDRCLVIANGHPLMRYVTGTGCAATVVIAAFRAVEPDSALATAAALAYFGLAGEKAAQESPGPGTFWQKVLDALYTITPEELEAGARVAQV
jgi:hydroxyethylthiazole kinase